MINKNKMNNQRVSKGFIIFLIILIIIFFTMGFFGQKHVENKGIECDRGIKDKLCWSWHTNRMDGVEEIIRNKTSSALDNLIEVK